MVHPIGVGPLAKHLGLGRYGYQSAAADRLEGLGHCGIASQVYQNATANVQWLEARQRHATLKFAGKGQIDRRSVTEPAGQAEQGPGRA
jgi:hypothetical protein